MHKLVQKHFVDSFTAGSSSTAAQGSTASSFERDRVAATEESVGRTVLMGAWRACEEELVRLTEGWRERVGQCYGEAAGAGLEFNVADVENAFRKHRGGA